MKTLIKVVLAFIVGFFAVSFVSTAFADGQGSYYVQDIYDTKTITKKIPVNECKDVDVPIYKQNNGEGSLGDFLAGAIIGGAIGNQVGDSKGNGAIGAIIGGAIANENAKKKNSTATIVGYKRERVCQTTYMTETENVNAYRKSIIIFNYEGKTYRLEFTK